MLSLGAGGAGLAADLIPGNASLADRHRDHASEIEQVLGSGQDRPASLDSEYNLIAFRQAKRVPNRLGQGDLAFGSELCGYVHLRSLSLPKSKDRGKGGRRARC